MDKLKIKLLKWLLSDQRIYSIVLALRGPDDCSETLKKIFTGRIRALLGLCSKYPGITCREEQKINFSDVVTVLNVVKGTHLHYLEHVATAVYFMQSLGLIGEREADFLIDLEMHLHDVASGGVYVEEVYRQLVDLAKKYSEFVEGIPNEG